jgi:hypothetical protein
MVVLLIISFPLLSAQLAEIVSNISLHKCVCVCVVCIWYVVCGIYGVYDVCGVYCVCGICVVCGLYTMCM